MLFMTIVFVVLMILNVANFETSYTHQTDRGSGVVYNYIGISSSFVLFSTSSLLIVIIYTLVKMQAVYFEQD